MEVGGIEPPTRVVAQGVTCPCDQIVTLFCLTTRIRGDVHQALNPQALFISTRQSFDCLDVRARLHAIRLEPLCNNFATDVLAIPRSL